MKTKKILALLLASTMVLTLVGCGSKDAKTDTTPDTPAVEDTGDTTPDVAAPTEASVDFEDGNFAFAGYNGKIAGGTGESTLSVVDFAGSKALQAVSTGKAINVAFQVDALLGDNVSKVKTIEVSLGVKASDGNFYACAGNMYAVLGENSDVIQKQPWSVYLETANPKVATFTVPEGMAFGAGNLFSVALETDNAATEGLDRSVLYIDNITFKDADGNVLAADSAAAFVVLDAEQDPNLLTLSNVTELEGFAVSAGGWSQAGNTLTEEQKALFVPGSVIEIEFKSDAVVWPLAICNEDNANPMGGWLRGVEQTGFISNGYTNADKTIVQYTYEQLVEFWGEDFGQYLDTLQFESSADWEVYSVKVGTNTGYKVLGDATEIEGFQANAGGWSQAGITLTDEQKALFVPGTTIEIEYKSDSPVWFVAICNEDNANPMGGWLRGVNQETFLVDGAVNADGTKVQYTYEQLVPYFGEDFGQYLDTLQCEGQAEWEVYSVKVGKTVVPQHNVSSIDGFAANAGGWSQAGIALTAEQKALFAPGCVITIEYKSDSPVWMVAICAEDNANPVGGWLRGVNQETFITDGTVFADGTKIQYTYEQLVPYWGEDFGQYLDTLQCEGQAEWEVYSMTVGMAN